MNDLGKYFKMDDGWNTGKPPFGVALICRNSYYGGWEIFRATAKEYAKPKPGQSRRAFRQGYRFLMDGDVNRPVQSRGIQWRLEE